MEQQRKVVTIPPTVSRFTAVPIAEQKKRRVAAYARVSTDSDEQFTSYEAQIDYYTQYIKARDDWEFVKVYTDEGITGTSTKHREGFKAMVADALAGKIDLIVTKSVSRFARNTKDLLELMEKLTAKGVGFISKKEAIDTGTPTGKFMLTVFAAVAELEREYILQRQREGIAVAKQAGKYKGRKPIDRAGLQPVLEEYHKGLLTATQAMRKMGVSRSTFYRLLAAR